MRHLIPVIIKRRSYSFVTFLDGVIRQTNQEESDTLANIDFNSYNGSINPLNSRSKSFTSIVFKLRMYIYLEENNNLSIEAFKVKTCS